MIQDMRVVAFQSLAQRKTAQTLRIACVCLLSSASLGLLSKGFPGTPLGPLAIIGGLACFVFGSQALHQAKPWEQGDDGEWLTLRKLQGKLTDEYVAIQNWVGPGTKQGDVDLLIVGPHGVLVCEIKNFKAHYACEGDNWVNVKPNGYRKRMKSPSRQLCKNMQAVEKWLRNQRIQTQVSGVLAVQPKARLDLVAPTVTILPWDKLADYVLNLPQRKFGVDEIVNRIEAKAA